MCEKKRLSNGEPLSSLFGNRNLDVERFIQHSGLLELVSGTFSETFKAFEAFEGQKSQVCLKGKDEGLKPPSKPLNASKP